MLYDHPGECRTVGNSDYDQQFFSELHSPGRSPTRQTTDTPGFKLFTKQQLVVLIYRFLPTYTCKQANVRYEDLD